MKKINLYISDAIWRQFRIACLEHGTSASKEVERLLCERLASWGIPLPTEEGGEHDG